jgi:hypothetical protein
MVVGIRPSLARRRARLTGTSPPESSIKGCGEALSGLGCALTIVGFGILAVVLLLILVV